mmetsp:Transcript_10605/g.35986  ORF Transcript_10605/g.35986 Transcript_10605/m.35986 type:complete len:84 (+) Transcript_10605:2127-2378(+)
MIENDWQSKCFTCTLLWEEVVQMLAAMLQFLDRILYGLKSMVHLVQIISIHAKIHCTLRKLLPNSAQFLHYAPRCTSNIVHAQ